MDERTDVHVNQVTAQINAASKKREIAPLKVKVTKVINAPKPIPAQGNPVVNRTG